MRSKKSNYKILIKQNLIYMINTSTPEDVFANNQRSLKSLNRAIAFSQGQFSLILACCNNLYLRQQVVKDIKEISTVEIAEIIIPSSAQTLFTTISIKIKDKHPQAVMVLGLESVISLNQVLISTNVVRNEFSKRFQFPLVLWVNDELMQKLIRLTPDFKNWATNSIRFEIPSNQRHEW